jgi:acyl carrier protein
MEPRDEIEAAVLRHLAEVTDVHPDRITRSDDVVRDLGADGDDLSFLFIPGIERDLGVTLSSTTWEHISTVQQVIDALRAARQDQRRPT